MSTPTLYKFCLRGEFVDDSRSRFHPELLHVCRRVVSLSYQRTTTEFGCNHNLPSAIVEFNLVNVLRRYMLAPGVGSDSHYKIYLPEIRKTGTSRTVEAPCSDEENSFLCKKSVEALAYMGVPETIHKEILAAIVSEKRRLITRGGRAGSAVYVAVDVEAIVDRQDVYDERIACEEILKAMEEAVQRLKHRNHYGGGCTERSEMKAVKEENTTSKSYGECVVCTEELTFDKAAQMPCSHVYHRDCISQWFKTKDICPLCRYRIPTVIAEAQSGGWRILHL
ncbi:uncharacterized protein [Populus alba]|uniref:RING-type E3 ubiquitin transferase n=2 Tax=Populus TaxID=3689 RepID=A0A4V6A9P2_POPAL|nr:uncharacterized protein LOC118055390 [Populus alba]TKS07956.1 hypothetical protein D5086_0000106060 [Populus alba]